MDIKLLSKIVESNLRKGKHCFSVAIADFVVSEPMLLQLYAIYVCYDLEKLTEIEWHYEISYTIRKIYFYREDFIMLANVVINIPYGERSKYFEIIKQINALVGKNGCCALFVNNVPYKLESLFVVETNQNAEEILRLIKEAKLSLVDEKELVELTAEVGNRKWSLCTLPTDNERVTFVLSQAFVFAEKEDFRKNGFDVDTDIKKKKLFISYCHSDKEIVLGIVAKLTQAGLYMWIDEQEIDWGENILQRISDGIKECDVAILFLSQNTLHANMAKHELITYLQKVIYSEKKIVPIVLDGVNVNDIIEGLGNYNYFLYKDDSQIEELVRRLQKKMS